MCLASSSAVVFSTSSSTQPCRGKTHRRLPWVATTFAILAARLLDNLDRRMPQRQHHAVVEAVDDPLCRVAEGNEVDDVAILVERAFDLAVDVVVVAVDRLFANVAAVGDEVSALEDEAFFLDANAVGFGP